MKTLAALLAVTIVSTSAWAGTDFTLSVKVDKDGKPSDCVWGSKPAEEDADGVVLSVIDDKGVARAPEQKLILHIAAKPKLPEVKLELEGDSKAALARGSYGDRKATLKDGAGNAITVSGKRCEKMLAREASAPDTGRDNGEAKPDKKESVSASRLNQQALAFLAEKGMVGHGVQGGAHGKQFRLYHLPDGTPAFPLPAHISEEDRVELWVALPMGGKATLEVIACDKVPSVRVRGSYGEAGKLAAKLQGLEEPELVLVPLGHSLHCAGTLTYKIASETATSKDDSTTSVTIDPVYRFEWGVGYGFDFGRPRSTSLADRQPASGASTDKVIVQTRDFAGHMPIITLSVDVCGTNPEAMDWCDRLLNPTIWVDPTRVTKGFGVGMVLRPFFGLGILLGASMYKSTELGDGVQAAPGDIWSAPGALPTKEVFNRYSLGPFVGATLDLEILTKLLD